MRLFLTIFLFLSIVASANFETVIKDQKFRDNFNLSPEENFVDLVEGFTYFNQYKQECQNIIFGTWVSFPLIFLILSIIYSQKNLIVLWH